MRANPPPHGRRYAGWSGWGADCSKRVSPINGSFGRHVAGNAWSRKKRQDGRQCSAASETAGGNALLADDHAVSAWRLRASYEGLDARYFAGWDVDSVRRVDGQGGAVHHLAAAE